MDAQELADAALKFGVESALVAFGCHVTRMSGLKGRRSDVIVINAFTPLLQEQFEGTQVRRVRESGGEEEEAQYDEEYDEVRCFVWSLKLDEARVPWAVFHSHVVGCSDPLRLEPQSVRARLVDAFPAYLRDLQSIPEDAHWDGQWAAPAPIFHVSGSEGPLAAMFERTVWLGNPRVEEDPLGQKILADAAKLALTAKTAKPSLSDARASAAGAAGARTGPVATAAAAPAAPALSPMALEYWLSNPTLRLTGRAAAETPLAPLTAEDQDALRATKLRA